jgi:antimicrobial peptide system SdpB family protein
MPLTYVVQAVRRAAEARDPRGANLAIGRTLLAGAELSVIVFTPDRALFVYQRHVPTGVWCDGQAALSLWCVTGASGRGLLTARVVAIVVLAVVATGYRPRWTCLPHWYVMYSLSMSLSLPNGGDNVARVATMLLIPLCLGDDRVWQWQSPVRALPAMWQGSGRAALLTVRLQVTAIYVTAALSKLAEPEWRNGTALYAVINDPNFGLSPTLQEFLGPVLSLRPAVAVATWSVVTAELCIAVCVLGPRQMRRLALLLTIVLHAAIVLMMGLFSFGLVMVGLLMIACAGGGNPGCLSAELNTAGWRRSGSRAMADAGDPRTRTERFADRGH